ncbi:limonene-1,2-epoxide hydrolase family protein [Streptomyces sp. B21-101]|uniref:limonene-1,2-epoxide hydrolase family protein n=1 Tax=Streptomyces sp. B21-101 TaxID=3039415 RepID=UPI002FF3F59C
MSASKGPEFSGLAIRRLADECKKEMRQEMSNTEIVNRFIAAMEDRDLESVMSFFADDATYHNMPMPILTGHEQIRAFIAPLFIEETEKASWDVLNSAEDAAGKVLNERVDHLFMRNGTEIHIKVMGIFELAGGKIVAWRDYFDLKTFTDQYPG